MPDELHLSSPVQKLRNTYRYTSEPVERTLVHILLDAAMCAPSADDERPWHFVVIREDLARQSLAEICPFTNIVKDVPLAIVVCGDKTLQKQQGCWVLDCAAATENILVEAQQVHLGAAWLYLYPIEGRVQRARSILKMPQNIVPFSIVAVGHPAEQKDCGSRFDIRRVHVEQWMQTEVEL